MDTGRLKEASMQTPPELGQFLAILVRLMGARKIIEIGTFTGYSATAMALALPEDGLIICCDLSWSWTSRARQYWQEAGVDNRIDLRLAPALATLDLLIEEGWDDFDMIFIDADKQHYPQYYEAVMKLLRPGGLIMMNNILLGGRLADSDNHEPAAEALRALNRQIYEDDSVDLSMIPIGKGLSLIRKR